MFQVPRSDRELHQFVELGPYHSQVTVSHPVAGIAHHEANHLRILVEELRSRGNLHGRFTVFGLLIEPRARAQDLVHQVLHHRRLLLDELPPDRQHAADVLRPFIPGHSQRARVARFLGSRPDGRAAEGAEASGSPEREVSVTAPGSPAVVVGGG